MYVVHFTKRFTSGPLTGCTAAQHVRCYDPQGARQMLAHALHGGSDALTGDRWVGEDIRIHEEDPR